MRNLRRTSDCSPKRDTNLGAGRVLSLRHGLGLVVLAMALVFGFAPMAEAHTDFESSNPANGSVVADPVSEIRVRFTAESLVAGDGFVVLTPSGEIVKPEVVVSPDQLEFTLLFDPPLVDGGVGVQWSVRAGDAHPIEGAFSFTTTAPTATEPEPQAVVESDTELASTVGPDETSSVESEVGPSSAIVPEADSPIALGSDQASNAKVDASSESAFNVDASADEAPTADAGTVSLDEFLNVAQGGGLAGPVGFAGRLASLAGSLIAIGVVAFALLVSSRSPGEMRVFVNLVRQAGVLTIIGALIEAVGLVMSLGSVYDALVSSAGFAVVLRLVGAAGLVVSSAAVRSEVQSAPVRVAPGQRRLVSAGGAFSGAVGAPENHLPVDGPLAHGSEPQVTFDTTAWWLAGVLALSYVFDGHTVTKGNRLLTAAIDLVHVGGGAVWLGGLICLLALSRSRRSKLEPAKFIESVVRFSVVAAVALGAVGVAGLALTVTILDSVSELWTTAWGRLLIAKVLTVAIAIAAGAFNHFVLVPELQAISAHDGARPSFLRTLKIEVGALGVALLVTAALVAAAS